MSHDGNCWIYPDAVVWGDCACIYGDAQIRGESDICGGSQIYGSAVIIDSQIDDAFVYGRARIKNSKLYGYGDIRGRSYIVNAEMKGSVSIYGSAKLKNCMVENAKIHGRANIAGGNISGIVRATLPINFDIPANAMIRRKQDIYKLNKRGFDVLFYRTNRNLIDVHCANKSLEYEYSKELQKCNVFGKYDYNDIKLVSLLIDSRIR